MKELDVLLSRYLEECYAGAPEAEQSAFRELLECQDPSIYAYCVGREQAPTPGLSALVARITGSRPNGR